MWLLMCGHLDNFWITWQNGISGGAGNGTRNRDANDTWGGPWKDFLKSAMSGKLSTEQLLSDVAGWLRGSASPPQGFPLSGKNHVLVCRLLEPLTEEVLQWGTRKSPQTKTISGTWKQSVTYWKILLSMYPWHLLQPITPRGFVSLCSFSLGPLAISSLPLQVRHLLQPGHGHTVPWMTWTRSSAPIVFKLVASFDVGGPASLNIFFFCVNISFCDVLWSWCSSCFFSVHFLFPLRHNPESYPGLMFYLQPFDNSSSSSSQSASQRWCILHIIHCFVFPINYETLRLT